MSRIRAAKAKGRRLQQMVRDLFLKHAPSLEPDDIRSTTMGESGEDILFSPAARRVYPYSVECKNQERLNMWKTIEQCEGNANGHTPLVIIKRNGQQPYACVPLSHFIELIGETNAETKD